jgi:hypothetical protein
LKEIQREPHTFDSVREEVGRVNEELREAQKSFVT